MLNPVEVYTEAGGLAATACNQRDDGRYRFHRDWYRAAVALEQLHDKEAASAAYRDGFQAVRIVPTVSCFR